MKAANNIILVDDDEIFIFLTKRIIEETQLANQIKVYNNGKSAIESLEQLVDNKGELPEVILLDLNMPVMDGWGFLEEYVAISPRLEKQIPIYIVSSSISPRDMERAKNISVVSDFIIKPLVKERFAEAMSKIA